MKIGNKLNQLRKLSGMTQEQLAEKIDAVTHQRADLYYGQRIKFYICNCVTKHNTQYMLYRYIATGQYANAPVDYMRLMIPSMITGAVGLVLFISYVIDSEKKETEKYV